MKPLEPQHVPTIIRFGRLGDMIMLTALMGYLHARDGAPCHVVGAGPWNIELYRGHPDVAQTWSFARHMPFPFSTAWPRVVWALRKSAPAPIYVCEQHDRQLARIRRLLKSSGVAPARCMFITDLPFLEDENWVDRLLRFGQSDLHSALNTVARPTTDRAWTPRLRVMDLERTQRDEWLKAKGWAGRDLVLIQPGNFRSMSRGRKGRDAGAADDKAWPAIRWAELFRNVRAKLPEAALILCGAPQEVPMLRQIQVAVGLDSVAVAGLPLRQLFALCESAHSMISVDTGPAHAAAALDLPLVVMYGSESPKRWLPRSASGSPVVGVGGPPGVSRVAAIPVELVFAAWCSILTEPNIQRI